MEQSATELQTFSQLKKQEDTAIPKRQEVNVMRCIFNRFNSDVLSVIHKLFEPFAYDMMFSDSDAGNLLLPIISCFGYILL